ncbi:MAG: glycosyltransferase family 2 protein [Bacteroidales bacterium]|nr:glycosyltransferase family 2 protein [Bacteroidales bacterium]
MSFADQYLSRQSLQKGLIKENPAEDLKFIVIIPSYNESGLLKSLDSLFKAVTPVSSVEIIVNINWPEDTKAEIVNQSLDLFNEATKWASIKSTEKRKFYILSSPSLKKKHAGVGLARKIAMDEAIVRLNSIDKKDGVICSFDADSICDPDYFQKLEEHFTKNPLTDGCSIYFEHPISGKEFQERIYQGIIQYELHLRYYLQAFRFSGHPNCFHTVGSSFAVKADAYCRQGGMNKKKAGEDFYFLQKIFDLGNFTECNTARVIPSSRPSDRVPFGTGKVMLEFLDSEINLQTYNIRLFIELKQFIDYISYTDPLTTNFKKDLFNAIPPVLAEFLESINFEATLDEIILNSSGEKSFRKRFFRWFNMFRVMKFLNFGKTIYSDMEVRAAATTLLNMKKINISENDPEKLLIIYRQLERN